MTAAANSGAEAAQVEQQQMREASVEEVSRGVADFLSNKAAVSEFERLIARQRIERTPVPVVDGKLVPGDIDAVQRVAHVVAAAGMVPEALCLRDANGDLVKGNDGQPIADMPKVCVAISTGMEAGMSAMMSVRWVMVINGIPAIWGDGAMGLVRRSGLLGGFWQGFENLDDKERLTLDSVAVCKIKRKGEDSGEEDGWHTYRFSVRDAITAGLMEAKRNGNNEILLVGQRVWCDYPKRMLSMRPRGFALRDVFADVLSGFSIAEAEPGSGRAVLVDGPTDGFLGGGGEQPKDSKPKQTARDRLAALKEEVGDGDEEQAEDGQAEQGRDTAPADDGGGSAVGGTGQGAGAAPGAVAGNGEAKRKRRTRRKPRNAQGGAADAGGGQVDHRQPAGDGGGDADAGGDETAGGEDPGVGG